MDIMPSKEIKESSEEKHISFQVPETIQKLNSLICENKENRFITELKFNLEHFTDCVICKNFFLTQIYDHKHKDFFLPHLADTNLFDQTDGTLDPILPWIKNINSIIDILKNQIKLLSDTKVKNLSQGVSYLESLLKENSNNKSHVKYQNIFVGLIVIIKTILLRT